MYVAVFVAGMLLAISLLHYLATVTPARWLRHLRWVALGAVACGSPPIVLKALASARNKVRRIGGTRALTKGVCSCTGLAVHLGNV